MSTINSDETILLPIDDKTLGEILVDIIMDVDSDVAAFFIPEYSEDPDAGEEELKWLTSRFRDRLKKEAL